MGIWIITSGLFTVAPILNPIQVLHCSFDSQDGSKSYVCLWHVWSNLNQIEGSSHSMNIPLLASCVYCCTKNHKLKTCTYCFIQMMYRFCNDVHILVSVPWINSEDLSIVCRNKAPFIIQSCLFFVFTVVL